MRGEVFTVQRRWQEAKHDLEEGVHIAREMSYPYLEGRAVYRQGVVSGRQGDREQARECLEAALAIFRRLAAQPFIERVQGALVEPQ